MFPSKFVRTTLFFGGRCTCAADTKILICYNFIFKLIKKTMKNLHFLQVITNAGEENSPAPVPGHAGPGMQRGYKYCTLPVLHSSSWSLRSSMQSQKQVAKIIFMFCDLILKNLAALLLEFSGLFHLELGFTSVSYQIQSLSGNRVFLVN